MSAHIIDGSALGRRIRDGVADEVTRIIAAGEPRPGLGVVLAGDDPASAIYVRNKTRACEQAGIHSVQLNLPADTSETDVLAAVRQLNDDPAVHAILVQLPLPRGIDTAAVLRAIDPRKDADGIHPENVAALTMGAPMVVPCTPAGIMECLKDEGVEVSGAEVVIVGRSRIVGKPLAALMLIADATVTVCHSRTRNLGEVTRRADILVAAAGRAGLIRGDMVKAGATVVDVGLNRRPNPNPGGKDIVVGDVDRESVEPVAGRLTPVPGGVGPLTIAMLLVNTVKAARTAQPASA